MFRRADNGKWIDAEKHVTQVDVSGPLRHTSREIGVVVFQYNSATREHRAVIKTQTVSSIVDADVAEAILKIAVKWPIV